MENKRTKALGMIIVLAAAIIWGSTGVAGEYLINQRGLDSAWITTYRTTLGGLVMLLILGAKMKGELFKVWKNKKDAIQMVIFGLFGAPRLEVAGAAVATVIGQCCAAVAAFIMNIKCNPDIHLNIKKVRWHWNTVKNIYEIGLPSIIMQCVGSVMVFGINRIVIPFTTTAAAVFGAYFKLQSFIFMPVFGLNNGMVPIIAYNFGAKKPDRVKKTIKLAVCVAVCIMAVGFALFELVPGTLLSLFDASPDMLAIGKPALRIIGIHFPLAGFCIIAGSVCQAIGNPMYSLTVSVCRQLVVLLPAAWLLSRTGNLDLVWLAFPIAELMSLTLSSIFLRKTIKRADQIMAQPVRR